MRKLLACLTLFVAVAAVGCGDSENFVFTNNNPVVQQTFRVQFTNVDTGGADNLLVQAFDANGNLVFGPVAFDAASNFFLDLPDGSDELQIAFRDGGDTLCVYQQLVTANNDTTVNDPVCLAVDDFVDSIELTPATAAIDVGQTQQFTLTAELVDGTNVDITDLVPLSTSAAGVATVDPTGLATGQSEGTATISALVFFLTDSSTLTVNDPTVTGFAPIELNFEDISETGQQLIFPQVPAQQVTPEDGDAQGDTDDGAVFVQLPFDFTLLGDTFDGLWMSTNGFLSTGANNSNVTSYFPLPIPNTQFEDVGDGEDANQGQPHNLIAVFWSDLVADFQDGTPPNLGNVPVALQVADDEFGTMYFDVRGEAPNRRAIFQWNVRPIESVFPILVQAVLGQVVADPRVISFEAKLFETSNVIEFHYQDVTVPDNPFPTAESVTIGVENNAGTQAVTWVHDNDPAANVVEDGDALRYTP